MTAAALMAGPRCAYWYQDSPDVVYRCRHDSCWAIIRELIRQRGGEPP